MQPQHLVNISQKLDPFIIVVWRIGLNLREWTCCVCVATSFLHQMIRTRLHEASPRMKGPQCVACQGFELETSLSRCVVDSSVGWLGMSFPLLQHGMHEFARDGLRSCPDVKWVL